MSEKRKKAEAAAAAYKTEEQLKQEAKERARQQALLEAKRKPRSATEKKVENFWYHYKWVTLACAAGLVMAALLVKDLVFKVDPDYTILFYSEQYYSEDVVDELIGLLTPCAQDRNGDGKVKIEIDTITFPASALLEQAQLYSEEEEYLQEPEVEEEEEWDPEAMLSTNASGDSYALVMKLMAVVAANADPIYLIDQATYDYLLRTEDEESHYNLFVRLDSIPAADRNRLDAMDTVLADSQYADQLEGLGFYFRTKDTKNDKTQAYWDDSLRLLEEIAR